MPEQKPVAQISFNQTGFLLQGNTEVETVVNTDASWLCMKNEAYAPWHKPVLGYYVAWAWLNSFCVEVSLGMGTVCLR